MGRVEAIGRALLPCLCALWVAGCGDDATPVTMERTATQEVSSDRVDGGGPVADGGLGCGRALLESFEITGAAHVQQPVYDDPPPVGGAHLACWADYGVYDTPVDPGTWVHNLEHGAVVLLHDCDGDCDAELQALRALAEAWPRILMTPFEGLPTRFAAVAWGHRVTMDCLDIAIVEAFYDDYFDMAPESVPSGKPDGC